MRFEADDYPIRLARPEDVPFLSEIERRACDLFDAFEFTATLPLYLTEESAFREAQRRGLLWVAHPRDRSPVAFALVEIMDGSAHLEELDVLPDHGRRGIGTRLVRTVCAWAADAKLPAVTLTTFRDIPWNAPLYSRLGFRILREEELTPSLAARMVDEEQHGIPRSLRVAMRFDVT
jgi:GNAT superfamily N-acetyltransferase